LNEPCPVAGNRSSRNENSNTSNSANQKNGIDRPKSERTIVALSSQVPRLAAARTPRENPRTIAKIRAAMVSSSV
jgi:hypothetical protein